jgi:peptidoglycan/xylan/chitin deacetylase (PgdA/CDA1 family)
MKPSIRALVLERVARRAGRRAGVVLVYHRIGSLGGAAATLSSEVDAHVFERQLEHLAQRYRVVPLAELRSAVAERRRGEPFPVALTFDDDLRSHATTALPALRARRLPATFFLTGASLDGASPFWWDDLAQVVDQGTLEVLGLPHMLVARALAGDPEGVKALARSVEALEPAQRAVLTERLRAAAGPPRDEGLRSADVRTLAEAGCEIGFHTRGHHPLAPLNDEGLAAALGEGRAELQEAAGSPLERIAYPHGRADERVASAARAAGFVEGFTGAAAAVRADADPLLLPRFQAATTLAGLSLQVARAVAAAERS